MERSVPNPIGTFAYPGGIRDHTLKKTPQVQNSKSVHQQNKPIQKEQIALNSSLKMKNSEPKKGDSTKPLWLKMKVA